MVQERRRRSAGEAADVAEFTLSDARISVAQLGFGSWDSLVASVAQPAADPRTAPTV